MRLLPMQAAPNKMLSLLRSKFLLKKLTVLLQGIQSLAQKTVGQPQLFMNCITNVE